MVADAGMLSAADLLALEEAGFRFIVGSKTSKAPYDLADHFEKHGNAFDDGQTIETTRRMGTGKKARTRRVVRQWSFKRCRHDNQAINAMVERAEAVAAVKRQLKKERFVKVTDAGPAVDWDLVERARYLAARPVFHRVRDSIAAHLTIVFTALAISREAQARTGLSINKIVKALRPLRTATITLGRQQITAEPRIPATAQQILDDLAQDGH